MKTAGLLSSAGLLLLITACDDSFSPEELAGSYRLSTIDGNPPPYIELATAECDQSISNGFLLLEADGAQVLTLTITLDCTRGGGNVGFQDRLYLGTFTVDGDRLEFSSVLQPDGENLSFQGQAREGAVIVDLPSAITQDLSHEMRFVEEDDQPSPQSESQARGPAATHRSAPH